MLEDALGQLAHRREPLAGDAFRTDDHHLARLDVVEIDRAHQVEGAGFRGEHVALVAAHLHLAHGEGAESVGVAGYDDAVGGQEDQREGAFQLQHGFAQRAGQRALARAGHQVQDHFGIARSLEDGAFLLQFGA